MKDDIKYLKSAIANSLKSSVMGNYPAGAVVVKNEKILSSEVSVPYPGLLHADFKAVQKAYEQSGNLKGATLYVASESCLMCLGASYWSGIRRIVVAVPRSKISSDYYETKKHLGHLEEDFNEPIEIIYIAELEQEALNIIKGWERRVLKK